MSTPTPDRMLGFVIHEAARLIRRRFEQYARAEGLGLTRAQAAVIAHLARQQGTNQAALAQVMEIEPITLVRLLDGLEAAGYLERRPDPTDRRAHVLHLLPKSDAVLEQIYGLAAKVYAEAQTGMSKTESAQLLDLLCRAKANLANAAFGAVTDTQITRRNRRA
jgi:MarR family transcriptional regulator for hemolysin